MSDANRLSAAQVMGRAEHASWGMHRDLLEAKGGLWQHRWTRSLHRIQQNVKSYLGTRRIWESQALPLHSCCARPCPYTLCCRIQRQQHVSSVHRSLCMERIAVILLYPDSSATCSHAALRI